MQTIKDRLVDFLENCKDRSGFRSYRTWLRDSDDKGGSNIEVYIRRTSRYINDRLYETFEIANVNVRENKQGQGIFTQFLVDVIELCKNKRVIDVIYIENVSSESFKQFFRRQQFISYKNDDLGVTSFYKMLL